MQLCYRWAVVMLQKGGACGGAETGGMSRRRRSLMRSLRRHRRWWPYWLAVAGAVAVALFAAVRSGPGGRGIAGPVVAVAVIAVIAGFATGLAEGFMQPRLIASLRIRLGLVVLVLIAAAILGDEPLGSGLAALCGAGVALVLRWCGQRMLGSMVGRDEDD